MDPLSVGGLALAVVSLGLQVTESITTYIEAFDCQDHEISSLRQQNGLLQRALQIVEKELQRLQHDHQDATAQVRECLDSCEKELEAMKVLLADLAAWKQPTTSRTNRIRNKGKRLLYPFVRKKLLQLEERLGNANNALQLALQILGL
ncbi:hypothetical protein F5144DRAFT_578730 [Chaetomium tenue]|uniref:Uncharacterized protein n=1 Tax=Chaetomium tenue TaxID=1854479 RepID=A0ACB7P6X9_9PEZI|nr:hypothetical protein F5144DRAFT_578730 [Chaetomium globosum]